MIIELKAFLKNLEDLWGTDDNGVETLMSIKRFKFITRLLKFDDKIILAQTSEE